MLTTEENLEKREFRKAWPRVIQDPEIARIAHLTSTHGKFTLILAIDVKLLNVALIDPGCDIFLISLEGITYRSKIRVEREFMSLYETRAWLLGLEQNIRYLLVDPEVGPQIHDQEIMRSLIELSDATRSLDGDIQQESELRKKLLSPAV